jgi:hypothetical protein
METVAAIPLEILFDINDVEAKLKIRSEAIIRDTVRTCIFSVEDI